VLKSNYHFIEISKKSTMKVLITILFFFLTINLSAQQAILLKDGIIIDGIGNPAKTGQNVLIENGIITKIGLGFGLPDNTKVIDCEGKSILPGLINMHGHMYGNTGGKIENIFDAYPPLYLAGGITTVFSPGEYDPEGSIELRSKIKNKEINGPNYLTAGPYFDYDPSQIGWINGSSDEKGTLSKFKQWKNKIDAVKVYTRIKEKQFKTIIKAARKEGLFVTGHLSSISAIDAINMGINGLEHGIYGMSELSGKELSYNDTNCKLAELNVNDNLVVNLIDTIVENGVYIDPTIVVFESVFPDFKPVTDDWMDYLSTKAQKNYKKRRANLNHDNLRCEKKAVQKQKEFVKVLFDKGGQIVTGTDPVAINLIPGYGLHREIENLVKSGIPNLQAIKAATFNGAQAIRQDKSIGSIEVGKRADLVVVKGNPAINIKDIGNTELILKEGEIYFPDDLRQSVKGLIGGFTNSALLKKALNAFTDIEKYTQGMTHEDFIADYKTIDAVILKIIIIGDVAGQLPATIKNKESIRYGS